MDLTSNFFVLSTNVYVYLYMYNYSQWVEPSINIHEKKGQAESLLTLSEGWQHHGDLGGCHL